MTVKEYTVSFLLSRGNLNKMFICVENTFRGLSGKSRRQLANCTCKCGRKFVAILYHIKTGNTRSCGCLRAETTSKLFRTHGYTKSNTYRCWQHMKDRCLNPENVDYFNYGARGIKICDRWLKFENFLQDMGERPKGLSIDRIDNDGDYCFNNCRWANNSQQASNRRSNHWIEYNGERLILKDWASRFNLEPSLIRYRLKAGWSLDRVFAK